MGNGVIFIDILKHNQTRHGLRNHPLYGIWASMVQRCENEHSGNFKYYGGRGIQVCKEWRLHPESFIYWGIENGYAPGLDIDRIDNNGNYCPDNCRFITHQENCASSKRRLRRDNKSGFRNVYATKHGTYEAYVQINGKQQFLGTFKTIEEAIRKRDEMEASIHDNPELMSEGSDGE